MKSKILAISLLTTSLTLASTAVLASDIAGVYRCKGSDPYINKDYAGTVTITNEGGKVYSLEMDYDTGEKSSATGVLEKNLLSVVFQDRNDVQNTGLQQYYFSDGNKKMKGDWIYLGKTKLGKEGCERTK